jgi:hypothetical protein
LPFSRKSPVYYTWLSMRDRCRNPRNVNWRHYGGRGILVCERWDSFKNFAADMGERPDHHSLDRINTNGNYEPSNCRWATREQQAHNTRLTRKVTIDGKTYIAAALAKQADIKTDTIVYRAEMGLSLDEVMSPHKRINKIGLGLGGLANGARQRKRTHCSKGHRFTPENTRITPEGWRNCRACHNAKMRRRTAQKA